MAGCGQPAANAPKAATPKPSATPTPFNIAVTLTGAAPVLFDPKGQRVAEMKAGQIVLDPKQATLPTGSGGGPDVDLNVAQGTATLYRDGKPAATLTADRMHADRAARTVVGTGNVVVRSLAPDAPSIRADTMTWSYDKNQIVGSGNVLVTRAPDLRVPGARFTADTGIRRFTIYGSGTPATGSF